MTTPQPTDESSLPPVACSLRRMLANARRRLRYWQTVSPSNTRKSRGEGISLAKADIHFLTKRLNSENAEVCHQGREKRS